jgi:hypothetical protein
MMTLKFVVVSIYLFLRVMASSSSSLSSTMMVGTTTAFHLRVVRRHSPWSSSSLSSSLSTISVSYSPLVRTTKSRTKALHVVQTNNESDVATSTTTTTTTTTTTPPIDVNETTEKYGLEVGLFQSLRQGGTEGTESAKDLLQKYGIAYLATSMPLAIISFAICYVLVDHGVDVSSMLAKIGIENTNPATETAGTVAIAYAAHKAASPIRFPPTVILTPIVAKWIGKEPK